MTNDFVTREANVGDLPAIYGVIDRAPDTMYGIEYDPQEFRHLYSKQLQNNPYDTYTKILCTFMGDQMVGVARCSFWPAWPFWSPGALFINRHIHTSELKCTLHSMTNKMIDVAEADGRYDYIMVTRKSRLDPFSRKEFFPDRFHREYGLRTIGVIEPFEVPRFDGYRMLLGKLVGKNTKELAIRHAYRLTK